MHVRYCENAFPLRSWLIAFLRRGVLQLTDPVECYLKNHFRESAKVPTSKGWLESLEKELIKDFWEVKSGNFKEY